MKTLRILLLLFIGMMVVQPIINAQTGAIYRDSDRRWRAAAYSVATIDGAAFTNEEWYQLWDDIQGIWGEGEIWRRVDDLCEGDISQSTKYVCVQFKRYPSADTIGTNHFIYSIPDGATNLTINDLDLLGVIKTLNIGDPGDEFGGVHMVEHTYVVDNPMKGVRRLKVVYRFRNDGKLALRVLYQNTSKQWNLITKVVYENVGVPFQGSRFSSYVAPPVEDTGLCYGCTIDVRVGTTVQPDMFVPSQGGYVPPRRRVYSGGGVVSGVTEAVVEDAVIPYVVHDPNY